MPGTRDAGSFFHSRPDPLNQPTPAIVARNAVRPLPRVALWLLGFAYVLPGFIGREPWKNADIASFGYMAVLAGVFPSGVPGDWFQPLLMGLAPEYQALLPYWMGAWAIQFASGWMAPDLAVRLLYAQILALTLRVSWSATYRLALSEGAQPVAFAFGGEARPVDYARALADGGLLALLACLGLAQLSHETTPALAQLLFTSLLLYGLAALPSGGLKPVLAAGAGVIGMVLSGAPSIAMMMALGGLLVLATASRSQKDAETRTQARTWQLAAVFLTILAAGWLAEALDQWRWRLSPLAADWRNWRNLGRLLLWFTWPAWPLVVWTLWRWRHQLKSPSRYRHLSLPLVFVAVALLTTAFTPGADRSLLLALPALTALAAFALPTLKRSVGALIDWFTLLFFSGWVITIWVVWLSMQAGFPAKPAANMARLLPGFVAPFSTLAFGLALLATLGWVWLVAWRVGRHRAAIWKSMVLPAGGTVLCWLLLTTLMLPGFDYARSYAPLVQRVKNETGSTSCLQVEGLSRAQLSALQFHGRYELQPFEKGASCAWLVIDEDTVLARIAAKDLDGWSLHATVRRPTDRNEAFAIFRRTP